MGPELATVATALGLYAAVVVSPGPNFALISRLAVSGARDAAAGAIIGLAIAATFYAVLTMTGLALLLAEVGWLATLVQMAGGCYLVCLGAMAWRSGAPKNAGRKALGVRGMVRGFRMGLLVELSNPKGIAFFLGFYAFAIPPGSPMWVKLAVLAGGFAVEVVWYGAVVVCLSSRPARSAYERCGRWIERGIGTLLAAFGIRLIAGRLW